MIKILVMDVDGTLTDGKVYIGNGSEMFKVFNIKDGFGIKDILPKYGIVPVIITARESKILEYRCRELNITELYQGVRDKKWKLDEIIDAFPEPLNYGNVAYIGDDIPDLQCMTAVKEANGIVGCPADAAKEVLAVSDFVSSKNGGEGAAREFIEFIVSKMNNV